MLFVKILIIGGGVTGLFTAYYLLQDGCCVTLVDTVLNGARTSIYNAGEVSPSNVPLPPISMRSIFARYFGFKGPVYISPFQIFKNVNWFAIATKKIRAGFDFEIMQLAQESLSLYKEFLDEVQMSIDRRDGLSAFFKDAKYALQVSEKFNGRFLEPREIETKGYVGFEGGVRFDNEFSLNPIKLYDVLRKKLLEMGCKILDGSKASLVSRNKREIEYASLGSERLQADVYIVAAGAWCKSVCKPLGYDPLIIPAKGMVLIFDTDGKDIVNESAMLEDYGISIAQHNSDTLTITGFFEINGFEDSFQQSRKDWLIARAEQHIARFKEIKVKHIESGIGFRPCTPDQFPVIGRIPGYTNAFIASGNCRLGLTLAPVTAKVLRSLVRDEKPAQIDMKLVSPSRFKR